MMGFSDRRIGRFGNSYFPIRLLIITVKIFKYVLKIVGYPKLRSLSLACEIGDSEIVGLTEGEHRIFAKKLAEAINN